MRILSNKTDHGDEQISLSVTDAENALRLLLRAVEWYYCECPMGPRLQAIHGANRDAPGTRGSHVSEPVRARLTLSSFDMENDPGALSGCDFGGYALGTHLGGGGGGQVYQATQIQLRREVCIKVFYPFGAQGGFAETALRRGIRALAALSHPSIVGVHELFGVRLADATVSVLVMDLLRGDPLDEWSHELQGGTEGAHAALCARVSVGYQVASALHVVHTGRFVDELGFEQTGIVHGDLKPSNILVCSGQRPVILDFLTIDAQRAMRTPARADKMTTLAFGTPRYMAPEQEHEGIASVRGDIHSLGMTFGVLFGPVAAHGRNVPEIVAMAYEGLASLATRMCRGATPELTTMAEVVDAIRGIAQRSRCALPEAPAAGQGDHGAETVRQAPIGLGPMARLRRLFGGR